MKSSQTEQAYKPGKAICDFWYVREFPNIAEPMSHFSILAKPRSLQQKLLSAFELFLKLAADW